MAIALGLAMFHYCVKLTFNMNMATFLLSNKVLTFQQLVQKICDIGDKA